MTSHLPRRILTALTLPTGMPVGGGFAVASQSVKSMLFCAASQARFAQLRRYRTVMATGFSYLQPWHGSSCNFKSP